MKADLCRLTKKEAASGGQQKPEKMIKDVSRLWKYINGGTPQD